MRKLVFLLTILLFFGHYAVAQQDSIVSRIFLLGDAGKLKEGKQPVLDWLKRHVNLDDEKNILVFLGDNIYEDGLPDEGAPEYIGAKNAIDYQINLVKGKKSKAFFVPGNHDWKGGKPGGWERVMNEVNYINTLRMDNIIAMPSGGCPGPVMAELNDKVVLVMMDSQWFLHLNDKPGPESNCTARTVEEFVTQLQEIAESHPDQLFLLAMHHPMYTYGVHGGAYGLKQHIFPFTDAIKGLYIPLPLLGSVYPVARGYFGVIQDTYHPVYLNMRNQIEAVLKKHPNVVTAAGHEHSLQLIVKDSIPYIVSGSAAKLTRLRKGRLSKFSVLDYGFSLLEIRQSGKVEVKFYTLDNTGLSAPAYSEALKKITPSEKILSTDTLLPAMGNTVAAANLSFEGKQLEKFLNGTNYRQEWITPIEAPVFNLAEEEGGLKPMQQSGGIQTKILRLVDTRKKEWTVRTVGIFPDAAIPADLRSTIPAKKLKDGVSGSYPFACLSVEPMEKALGLPTLKRKIVYVPDDPRLDRFRKAFKNTLAILEQQEPAGVTKTYNTNELLLQLAKDINDRVDEKRVLRARLLDNFVMDFDRYEGQWRWATRDTGIGKLYSPVALEHNQAFYRGKGFLSGLFAGSWFVPQLQGFRTKARNIKTFNRSARNFDRLFLTGLSRADWETEIDAFLSKMTDTVIGEGMNLQPASIRHYSAKKIANTLQERRKYLRKEMLEYYAFIARQVNVVGSNQRDFFNVVIKDNGQVEIEVKKIEKNGITGPRVYYRVFEEGVTKEIRIYALEDDDSIVYTGARTKIRIRIIGGPGKDKYLHEGNGRMIAYDASYEENSFAGKGSITDRTSSSPEVNRYNRFDFKENTIKPAVQAEFNKDEGFSFRTELEAINQAFRKEPYGMRQFISVRKAAGTGSWAFRYEADYIKLARKFDVAIRADIRTPVNVTNFFGLGNRTIFNRAKGVNYYRVNYDYVNIELFARRQLQSWLQFSFGPAYRQWQLRENKNTGSFVADTMLNGLENKYLYTPKKHLGAFAKIEINSVNNIVLPNRGANIKARLGHFAGLQTGSNPFTQASLDIRIYSSFTAATKLVIATRAGIGRSFGKFDFPQGQYLGGTENLRGFRKDRFAGRSVMYNNVEVRYRLADFTINLFPGSMGVLVFHDVGKVAVKEASSAKWHNGYGAGIWVSPVKRFVIVASLARSAEENWMPLLTYGFQF